MGIRLVGDPDTKRTEYFLKAAEQCHVPVGFAGWDEVEQTDFRGDVVKLDPPSYRTANLFEMNGRIAEYRTALAKMRGAGCRFLNPPEGIDRVLDKRACKEMLMERGIPVTQMLPEEIKNRDALSAAMERHRVFSVFIKPVFCSGAAGVVAYRRTPAGGREAAYASCRLRDGELVNTKTLCRMEDPREIHPILDAVLSLGAVVERWHPKAVFRGKSYDLRVVWQFGKPIFSVARQSRGPVTNLHLNNAPLAVGQLELPKHIVREIQDVCGEAMAVFPELSVAGIDVLLEKNTLRPHIIEINGQGDLMYQDIFQENRIYREQIRYMDSLAGKPT